MKRQIPVIIENLPVSFDTRVWKEVTSLHANGYDVIVLCPRRKGFARKYELINGVHIYRHPMPKERNTPLGSLYEDSCAPFWEFF